VDVVAKVAAFTCKSVALHGGLEESGMMSGCVGRLLLLTTCAYTLLLPLHMYTVHQHSSLQRERDHAIYKYQQPPWANLAYVLTNTCRWISLTDPCR
jgi:hypothetical protein